MKAVKYFFFVLVLLFVADSNAQQKDTRARITYNGGVHEMSVSPDGRIWLGAMGKCYYTNSIDSDWHNLTYLTKQGDGIITRDFSNVDRISFFNKDTAVMNGYITDPGRNKCYYVTTDGGVTWVSHPFDDQLWIYAACLYGENTWMVGGLSPHIYYSSDYGQHISRLKISTVLGGSIVSIYMCNNLVGYASNDENGLYATTDNWKTAVTIPTPVDQGICPKNDVFHHGDKIRNIHVWKDYIIMSENGTFYYSLNKSHTEWKSFPVSIKCVDVDTANNLVYAITKNQRILKFSSPTEYVNFTSEFIKIYPSYIKAGNKEVYFGDAGGYVGMATPIQIKYAGPYTYDEKIDQPWVVCKYKQLTWGASGGELYLSQNGIDWYRENALDFNIYNIKAIDDFTAILEDNAGNEYAYSIASHTVKKYTPDNPLAGFLKSPLRSVTLSGGYSGCFSGNENKITYGANESTFQATYYTIEQGRYPDTIKYDRQIKTKELNDVLSEVNERVGVAPVWHDFKITKDDEEQYREMVHARLASQNNVDDMEDAMMGRKMPDKKFYDSISSVINTINDTVVKDFFNNGEGIMSTTHYWFAVEMINFAGDTIQFSHTYYKQPKPWYLPWKVRCKGLVFNSYDINFSRLIMNSIPNNFYGKRSFSNAELIMDITDYLYNRKPEN